MNAVNYEAIRQRNIEEYGKGTRHLAYLSDLYENRTHFLYELLQNAEDALAKRETPEETGYVDIRLHEDRLELRHNGKPFDEPDVNGICGIGEGTKAGDYSQIGKFGIGFKSVYAYTLAPRIHSNGENFEVRRFVEPHALPDEFIPSDVKQIETCIVLQFDNQAKIQTFRAYVPPQQAAFEIGEALKSLGLRTLLFLKYIDEVRWTLPDGLQGAFLRETRPVEENPTARYVDVTDGNTSETWLLFRRDTAVADEGKSHKVAVEVGYLVQGGKLVRAKNTELVVSFPTAKRTELGFLIQGPFKTTKARDNIASESEANQLLIRTAAQLAADTLEELRDLGLLDVDSFMALPLKSSIFEEKGTKFFLPVYHAICEALKSKCLLPRHKGGFISAHEARLARGAQLAEVFSPEQLGALFGGEQKFWLDTAITADRMPDLHAYLAGRRKQWPRNEWEQEPLVEGVEVEAAQLAAKLTERFFQEQDDSWLTKFYDYLPKNFEPYRNSPFIRLEDGRHVNKEQAFLPPCDPSGIDSQVFPLVRQSLLENKNSLEFLREKAKLREPDAADLVIKCLLPKYDTGTLPFDLTEYEHDLKRVIAVYQSAARERLIPKLNATKFIACTRAGSPESDEVVWRAPGDQRIFIRTSELDSWFADNDQDEAWFIHPLAKQLLSNLNSDLVLAREVPLLDCDPSNRGKICLRKWHSSHRQGLDGFHPDAQILGLKYALNNWSLSRARYLWSVLLDIPHLIKGDVQEESNASRLDAAERIPTLSMLGKACVDAAWLPNRVGVPFEPKQLLLSDLPDGFDTASLRARNVAEKLSMKQPEREQAMEMITGGDSILKGLIDLYQSGSDTDREKLKKMIPSEVPPRPAPAFKDGIKDLSRRQCGEPRDQSTSSSPVANPNRYQKKLDEGVESAVASHWGSTQTITFSPVRNVSPNSDARNFLYAEYQGRCQVTGQTFPKASANAEGDAENYFEACALLSYAGAEYLNDPGNMLCVSADTMAKFKHASVSWLEDFASVIERFMSRDLGGTAAARISLAGKEATITWSERHFMRLLALWNKA